MPTPVIIPRPAEIDRVLQALRGSHCVSVIGLSNMGKSTLLRSLQAPVVIARYELETRRDAAIVYVDCNGMFTMSGQGFYELILRAVMNVIEEPELLAVLEEQYQRIVEPDSEFLVPLSFNKAMTEIVERGHRDLILLLDEFDEVFDALDGRVFLNLRHLKDRYPRNLVYVTATVRRLGSKRVDDQTAEFVELSAPFTYTLRPLLREEADALAVGLLRDANVAPDLSQDELDFLWEQAGGHPRLVRAALSQLAEYIYAGGIGYEEDDPFDVLAEHYRHDNTIRSEVKRLVMQVAPEEREALSDVVAGSAPLVEPQVLNALDGWGLIRWEEGEPVIFAELLADYLRRQARAQDERPDGVWVDLDAGEVWVEGEATQPLTELEFRLMRLLFERRDKVTDKYRIVETVWGVEYIDEVDDARIEKLVQRLRGKVEPDRGSPRYIQTVRGRGYKLVSGD